jgi:nitrite reductase (NO-forming)
MWNKLRDWYLALIGIIVIAGGLYIASHPNFTSSFHVIGEIFDRVYVFGGVLSKPLEGIQTVSVAPGGAVIVEFKLQVPGNYTIVDHALTRLERGLVGILSVEGPPNPDIYNGKQ